LRVGWIQSVVDERSRHCHVDRGIGRGRIGQASSVETSLSGRGRCSERSSLKIGENPQGPNKRDQQQ